MQTFVRWIIVFVLLCSYQAHAAPPSTTKTGSRLTVELQDGSRIIGKSGDETFQFNSDVLGEMNLSLNKIRSIECQPKTNSVKLATANGDALVVQFTTKEIKIETSFGDFNLPANLIRRIQISKIGKPGQRPGLVSVWSAEGNGDDAAGDNNATLTDISFADGISGQAFSFNGTSSSIKIPASPSLDVAAGDGFTITAWIKPSDVSGFHPLLQWSDSVAVNFSLGARPSDSGGLWACITDGEGNRFVNSYPGVLVTGVFQHIAVTFDKTSGVGTWYLNGVIVAQRLLSGHVTGTKGDLLISHRDTTQGNWSSNRSFAGLMDELAIYNRALTASEIKEICMEENHGEPLPLPAPSTGWYESWMR